MLIIYPGTNSAIRFSTDLTLLINIIFIWEPTPRLDTSKGQVLKHPCRYKFITIVIKSTIPPHLFYFAMDDKKPPSLTVYGIYTYTYRL